MTSPIPAGATRDPSLWFERYAELLGCDPEPACVSARIAELVAFRDRAMATIGVLRGRLAAAGVSDDTHASGSAGIGVQSSHTSSAGST